MPRLLSADSAGQFVVSLNGRVVLGSGPYAGKPLSQVRLAPSRCSSHACAHLCTQQSHMRSHGMPVVQLHTSQSHNWCGIAHHEAASPAAGLALLGCIWTAVVQHTTQCRWWQLRDYSACCWRRSRSTTRSTCRRTCTRRRRRTRCRRRASRSCWPPWRCATHCLCAAAEAALEDSRRCSAQRCSGRPAAPAELAAELLVTG